MVIKATNKGLHRKNLVVLNGVEYRVQENILRETSILKYLSNDKRCPQSLTKYLDCFQR